MIDRLAFLGTRLAWEAYLAGADPAAAPRIFASVDQAVEFDQAFAIVLRERLITTSARLVRHARYAVFQIAETALPRQTIASIVALINGPRGAPAVTMSA